MITATLDLRDIKRRVFHSLEIINARFSGNECCVACGFSGKRKYKAVLWPELISEWELDEQWANWFNEREGSYCVNCYASLRTNQLAEALLKGFELLTGIKGKNLNDICSNPELKNLTVAEINSAGTIHKFLEKIPGLYYSEYGSKQPQIRSENLEMLSYQDSFFDLVVTSETLEHVPDFNRALSEIHRVLKPGGMHIFTIPVVWERTSTKIRAKLENGSVVYLYPPSYHGAPQDNFEDYLVFSEFGNDVVEVVRTAGFDVELLHDEKNKALVTFLTRKLNS